MKWVGPEVLRRDERERGKEKKGKRKTISRWKIEIQNTIAVEAIADLDNLLPAFLFFLEAYTLLHYSCSLSYTAHPI